MLWSSVAWLWCFMLCCGLAYRVVMWLGRAVLLRGFVWLVLAWWHAIPWLGDMLCHGLACSGLAWNVVHGVVCCAVLFCAMHWLGILCYVVAWCTMPCRAVLLHDELWRGLCWHAEP